MAQFKTYTMKRKFFICSILFCVATACTSQNSSSSSYSSSDEKKGTHTITVNDESGSLKIEARGDIIFNDDETAVQSISREGYLKYKKNGKKLSATPDDNGVIYYTYNDGAKTQALNDDGKKFLVDAIRIMIEHGVDTKGHIDRLYKKGGTAAVLNDFDNVKSDYVKKMFIEYLLDKNVLTADDMTTVANKISKQISSDYEKGSLLSQFSEKYLSNPQTAAAYLGAVKSIGSDYEKANALKNIFSQSLSNELFVQVMEIANTVGSDYEKAGILEDIISDNDLSDDRFLSVVSAAKSIGSDYEKANVLEKILSKNNVPANRFNETIAAVASIGSDYEKAGVLKNLAQKNLSSDDLWLAVIGAAEDIGSDYEKADLLEEIADNMPKNDNVRSAFMKAAKTISSEYEYGRLMKSID